MYGIPRDPVHVLSARPELGVRAMPVAVVQAHDRPHPLDVRRAGLDDDVVDVPEGRSELTGRARDPDEPLGLVGEGEQDRLSQCPQPLPFGRDDLILVTGRDGRPRNRPPGGGDRLPTDHEEMAFVGQLGLFDRRERVVPDVVRVDDIEPPIGGRRRRADCRDQRLVTRVERFSPPPSARGNTGGDHPAGSWRRCRRRGRSEEQAGRRQEEEKYTEEPRCGDADVPADDHRRRR